MVVEDFEGRAYGIESVSSIPQRVSVCENFGKSKQWSPFPFDMGLLSIDTRFNISSVEDVDENTKRITFLSDKKGADENRKYAAYKNLLQEMDLYQENLRTLVKQLLMKVFMLKDLKKLAKEDRVEFVMDNALAYIKCGNKAYRV